MQYRPITYEGHIIPYKVVALRKYLMYGEQYAPLVKVATEIPERDYEAVIISTKTTEKFHLRQLSDVVNYDTPNSKQRAADAFISSYKKVQQYEDHIVAQF